MLRLVLEARRRQNIQVSGFEFVWPCRRRLGFHAHLGGHEFGWVLYLEVDLSANCVHGAGLLQAKV